jgi:hypothetical protein
MNSRRIILATLSVGVERPLMLGLATATHGFLSCEKTVKQLITIKRAINGFFDFIFVHFSVVQIFGLFNCGNQSNVARTKSLFANYATELLLLNLFSV